MIANNNFRCRKVVDVGNLFGRVWQVSTRSVRALLPWEKRLGAAVEKR
jgi:hypothetical protein